MTSQTKWSKCFERIWPVGFVFAVMCDQDMWMFEVLASESNTPPDQPITKFRRGGKKLLADGVLVQVFAVR